jgi:crotonobetainyl-CoA:carnitine CoA-transferase CaiB-like acyl-CoA transferase
MRHPEPAGFHDLRAALGLTGSVTLSGAGLLTSVYPVSDLATAAMSAVAGALSELTSRLGFTDGASARVDRALSDAWFGLHVRPVGSTAPSAWDPLSGAFETRDRSWIRTHANAPRHRDALIAVLGCDADPDAVARAIRGWNALELEDAVIARGGAAAALRTAAEWQESAPGAAVAGEPLVHRADGEGGHSDTRWAPTPARPLAGIRVLDLTRVIAGPACTQVLAGLGAEVLRIDPPDWDEPAVLPYVMWNKRSARLDARTPGGAERLRELLAGADILVHGYRAGALEHLGLAEPERRRIRPGLIDVAERAYGWSGPWAERRGFDSLVQFATGIAYTGMVASGAAQPVSLPVQALDWATGYLAAASAIAGLVLRLETNAGSQWRLSLARTAYALAHLPVAQGATDVVGTPADLPAAVHRTASGDMALTSSPLTVGAATLAYDRHTTRLGVDEPAWSAA